MARHDNVNFSYLKIVHWILPCVLARAVISLNSSYMHVSVSNVISTSFSYNIHVHFKWGKNSSFLWLCSWVHFCYTCIDFVYLFFYSNRILWCTSVRRGTITSLTSTIAEIIVNPRNDRKLREAHGHRVTSNNKYCTWHTHARTCRYYSWLMLMLTSLTANVFDVMVN